MKLRSIASTLLLGALAGCTIEHVQGSNAPPPAPVNQPAPAVGAATPPPATTTEATPPPVSGSGGTVAAGGGVVTPVGGAGGGVSVTWGNFKSPGGEVPNASCTKESNKDLCWDGVDNNCDGHIDEGCPYGGGDSGLHFIIAWKVNVDLDLHVMGPDGVEVNFKQRAGGSLVLDKDCHGDDCGGNNIENVYTPGAIAKGHYKAWINVGNSKGYKDATIPFTFGAGVGAKAFLVPFIVPNKPGEKKAFEFDVI
jgi:hypothetical protein